MTPRAPRHAVSGPQLARRLKLRAPSERVLPVCPPTAGQGYCSAHATGGRFEAGVGDRPRNFVQRCTLGRTARREPCTPIASRRSNIGPGRCPSAAGLQVLSLRDAGLEVPGISSPFHENLQLRAGRRHANDRRLHCLRAAETHQPGNRVRPATILGTRSAWPPPPVNRAPTGPRWKMLGHLAGRAAAIGAASQRRRQRARTAPKGLAPIPAWVC